MTLLFPTALLASVVTKKSRSKPLPEAISMQHAADLLDVSRVTVRRWIRRGYIKAYRVGPQAIRIPRSEIARMRTLRMPFIIEREIPKYPTI